MTDALPPGWYRDPAEPETQRWWDGEQWVGERLPADATPPDGPLLPTGAESHAPGISQPQAVSRPSATSWPPPAAYSAPPRARYADPAVAKALAATLGGSVAPLGARFMARFVDLLALLGLNALVNGWFIYQYIREVWPIFVETYQTILEGGQAGTPQLTERATNLNLAILFISLALWFAYEVPALANTGQTPGKRLFGIKVVRLDGSSLGFGAAFRRWAFFAIPNLLWPCGLLIQIVDSLWCTWDRPLRQCGHDKLVRTAVVMASSSPSHPPTG